MYQAIALDNYKSLVPPIDDHDGTFNDPEFKSDDLMYDNKTSYILLASDMQSHKNFFRKVFGEISSLASFQSKEDIIIPNENTFSSVVLYVSDLSHKYIYDSSHSRALIFPSHLAFANFDYSDPKIELINPITIEKFKSTYPEVTNYIEKAKKIIPSYFPGCNLSLEIIDDPDSDTGFEEALLRIKTGKITNELLENLTKVYDSVFTNPEVDSSILNIDLE